MTPSSEAPRPIDLSHFERVCLPLREALVPHKAAPDDLFILDSVVKRFELTYELAVRSLRRYLLDYSPSPTEIESFTFQEFTPQGDELGLLAHKWPEWKLYREARNETSHSYREGKARELAADAEIFLAEAQHLLDNLKRRVERHG